MHRGSVKLAIVVLLSAACLALAACNSSGLEPLPVGFTLTASPANAHAVPGERYVLLISAADDPAATTAGGEITISAVCAGATVTIDNPQVLAGEVAEVVLIPDATAPSGLAASAARTASAGADPDWTLTVTATGLRDGLTKTATAAVGVITGWENTIAAEAATERDRIIPWLAANHPELGITSETQWTGAMPAPLLIVTHYLYFSDEWELHVAWHVMIAPYDWTKYELRRRSEETSYSQGFVISSRSAVPAVDPTAMTPENTLWR